MLLLLAEYFSNTRIQTFTSVIECEYVGLRSWCLSLLSRGKIMWIVSVQQNANQGSDAAWGRVREAEDEEEEAGGGRSKMDYEGRRSWGQKDPREMSRFPLLVPSTSTSLVVHPRRTERMWTRRVRELAVTWSPHFGEKRKADRPRERWALTGNSFTVFLLTKALQVGTESERM